ncbi:hypothetical protein NDU88_010644 [Pleurodeles waltl]|uniref:Gypsy retrotransposon integrase-like protein 1 n=1 Tax=Pleurodeles waltl TaxID=8319 RepID=A0AAV7RZV9_PLEWA|nr:hypothetical protein NDU88_010644 [Pleurodeles waltl]
MASMDDVLQALVVVQQELANSRVEAAALKDKVERLTRNPFDASASTPQVTVNVSPPIPLASPERFSGDPRKVQAFLTQLSLQFSCRPASFPSNLSRVMFAISYLSGDAANWAVPLVRNDDPLLSDWNAFRSAFEKVFDHRTTTFSADRELLELRQGRSDLVTYLTTFNRLVAESEWPEEKRMSLYYQGLRDDMKDILAQIDPQPSTCTELVNLTLRLNHRLAERRGERRAGDRRPVIPEKEGRPVPNSHDLCGEPMEVGAVRAPLSRAEKESRRVQGLCMYCGRKGHYVRECPQKPRKKFSYSPTRKAAVTSGKISEKEDLPFIEPLSGFRLTSLTLLPQEEKASHLLLSVELVSQDRTHPVWAMIDSGATGNFIDEGVVKRLGLLRIPRKNPEIVLAVDGTPLKSGPLTEQTEDVGLVFSGVSPARREIIRLDIIEAPQYEIILGMPWLRKSNPVIDWQTKTVSFQSLRSEKVCSLYDNPPALALAQGLQLATVVEKAVILPSVYAKFKDLFDEGQAETLPPHRIYDCKIDLIPGALLPSCRVYALSDPETKHLRRYLDRFLEIGFIRPSCSPAASPLFFIAKANKELRTCIDYRMLNKNTIRNRYPLPLIPVLLEQVKEATIYTRLDLKGAYHLVRIREGDEWKTAFKTRYGLFEYLVMPFGLCNAPAAFQYFLNDVLKEYVDHFVIVYIDDILVYSTSLEQHMEHVSLVLQALQQHHLYCKLSKCEFHIQKVEFLGVDLSPEGFCMSTRKIQAVQAWPVPTSVRDVQCFLGFSNYYRRFICHFSHIVSPITRLLRKGVSFVWSEEAEEAFCFLKQAFCSAPILQHPQPEVPFIVEADASDIAIGAVLSQRNKTSGQLHPVAFLSKKLSAAELNYTVAEKELLAIKKAFQEWRHYLWGAQHPVTVYTDHRNLQYMKEARQLTQRQMRWMLFFSEYEFVVTFRPGVDNRKADSLSRQRDARNITSRPDEAIIQPEKVLCALHISHFLEKVSKHKSAAQWKEWAEVSQDRTLKHGIPLQGNRLYLPTPELRMQAFNWCHDAVTAGHPGYTKTAQIVQRHFRWKGWAKDVATWVARCEICARSKGENAKSQGKLMPLPTPEKPWQTISVDFVVGLPMDQGYNAIMVFPPTNRWPDGAPQPNPEEISEVLCKGRPGIVGVIAMAGRTIVQQCLA